MAHSSPDSLSFKDLRILSRGPLVCILVVIYVTATTAYSANSLFPAGPHKILNISSFLGMVTLVMFCLFSVICDGPGYVPLKWKKGNKDRMLYCKSCKGYKAPRSEHCRKCGRCVLKMCHHCSVLNVCIGHYNQKNFVFLLVFTLTACLQSLATNFFGVKRLLSEKFPAEMKDSLPRKTVWNLMFCIGTAAVVSVFAAIYILKQLKIILSNLTDSEKDQFSIIKEWKSFLGEHVPEWPYNFGWKLNLQQVINRSFLAEGDGVTWKVRDSSEGEEAENSKIDMYWVAGMIIDIERRQSQPMDVCVKRNFTYDRLRLTKEDIILAIQWKKDLVLVEKIVPDQPKQAGWIPRRCISRKQQKTKDE